MPSSYVNAWRGPISTPSEDQGKEEPLEKRWEVSRSGTRDFSRPAFCFRTTGVMTNALASYIENHILMGFIPFVSGISSVKVDFSELNRKQMVVKPLL